MSHDVGDKYLPFQSLDARNLQSTDDCYNCPVCDSVWRKDCETPPETSSQHNLQLRRCPRALRCS